MSAGAIDDRAVLRALSAVEDPDLHRDIVSLGFVQELKVSATSISFKLVLTTPACPLREKFRRECERVIREELSFSGDIEVRIDATVAPGHRASGAENLLSTATNTIAVASGKGGVGKSTVAVNLALALSLSGARTGLLDADIYGPSMGVMLGVKEKPETDPERGKLIPLQACGIWAISLGFLLDPDTPVIWRGPMVMRALEQLMKDVDWPELDYMVVDLPPGTGDAQLTLTQKVPLSGAVIVTTPNEVALIDARKGLAMFVKAGVPILGIVENMSYFQCPHCDGRTDIFSIGGGARTAEEMGVPLLGEIPLDPSVRSSGDSGSPTVLCAPESPAGRAFLALAENVARQASIASRGEKTR